VLLRRRHFVENGKTLRVCMWFVVDAKVEAEAEAEAAGKRKAECDVSMHSRLDSDAEDDPVSRQDKWDAEFEHEQTGWEDACGGVMPMADATPRVGVFTRPQRDVGVYTYSSSPWNVLIPLRYRL
jgi:hypothetical protein